MEVQDWRVPALERGGVALQAIWGGASFDEFEVVSRDGIGDACEEGVPPPDPTIQEACNGVDDDLDGRTDEGCTALVTTYEHNAFNELLWLTGPDGSVTTFTYDGNGNQSSRSGPEGTTTYWWDPRDRLAAVTLPSGLVNSFGYDPSGLRVFMHDSAGPRRVLLDGMEELAEYDAAPAPCLPATTTTRPVWTLSWLSSPPRGSTTCWPTPLGASLR